MVVALNFWIGDKLFPMRQDLDVDDEIEKLAHVLSQAAIKSVKVQELAKAESLRHELEAFNYMTISSKLR